MMTMSALRRMRPTAQVWRGGVFVAVAQASAFLGEAGLGGRKISLLSPGPPPAHRLEPHLHLLTHTGPAVLLFRAIRELHPS
jgi:hypothetical protein